MVALLMGDQGCALTLGAQGLGQKGNGEAADAVFVIRSFRFVPAPRTTSPHTRSVSLLSKHARTGTGRTAAAPAAVHRNHIDTARLGILR